MADERKYMGVTFWKHERNGYWQYFSWKSGGYCFADSLFGIKKLIKTEKKGAA